MKKASKNFVSLFMSIVELALGILLLIDANKVASVVLIVAGVVLAILGVVSIVGYFAASAEAAARGKGLSNGLLYTFAGVFILLNTGFILGSLGILAKIIGAFILIIGFGKVQTTVDMLRTKQKFWILSLIGAIIAVALGVYVIMHTGSSLSILWLVIAIILIVQAVIDILSFVFSGGKKRR